MESVFDDPGGPTIMSGTRACMQTKVRKVVAEARPGSRTGGDGRRWLKLVFRL
jgi:hypothetical protein